MNACAILPIAALLTVLCTISVSCSLAVSAGHVPPWPQISMCGMYPPERYVFSLGFSIGSMLLGILLVINHLRASQLDPARTPWHGEVHLGVGLASALCLALMATVPVSEYPVPHVMFAVFFFVLVLIFQAINTATRLRNLGTAFSAHVAAKEGWMVLWMLACAVAFVTWQATGSTLSQYLAVAAVMLHFSPYVFELQDSHLHLQVDVLEADGNGEGASITQRLLHDRVERRQQGGAPGWITVLTVLVVCAILGLILGQVRPPPR